MSALAPTLTIRTAAPADIPALERLIVGSARRLSQGFYDEPQIQAVIDHVFGVDSELIADGTYLLAEWDGALAGCGGWSRRATLFGGDRFAARASGILDPAADSARIRAFFVADNQARRGIGHALLSQCEASAVAAGFRTATLMATLPGEPFYRAQGYCVERHVAQDCGGVIVPFVEMRKPLLATYIG